MWRDEGAIVFNGPDEQLLSGLAAGAVGGVRAPPASLEPGDAPTVKEAADMIAAAVGKLKK